MKYFLTIAVLSILFIGVFSVFPAPASDKLKEQSQSIKFSEDGKTINIIVDGKTILSITENGILVNGNIEYSGTIADIGSKAEGL